MDGNFKRTFLPPPSGTTPSLVGACSDGGAPCKQPGWLALLGGPPGRFWLLLRLKSAERERNCRCRMHRRQYTRSCCRLSHRQCHWASRPRVWKGRCAAIRSPSTPSRSTITAAEERCERASSMSPRCTANWQTSSGVCQTSRRRPHGWTRPRPYRTGRPATCRSCSSILRCSCVPAMTLTSSCWVSSAPPHRSRRTRRFSLRRFV